MGITAQVSRFVPAAELAAYWIALSGLALVVLVAQCGVGQVAISQISQAIAHGEAGQAQAMATSGMCVVLLAGAGAALVVTWMLLSGWTGGGETPQAAALVLVLVGGVLCSLAMQVVDTLRSHLRLSAASWLASQPATGGVIPSTCLVLGLAAVSLLPPTGISPLTWVCTLFLLGWLLMLVVGVILLRQSASLAPRWDGLEVQRMVKLIHSALPVIVGSLAMFAITQADLWFVYRHASALDTATYGIAASFVKYVSALNVMLGALLPGLVGRMWAQGERERLRALLVKTGRLGAAAAALIVGMLALVGAPLLETIVGPAYVGAWAPLMVLSVGHLVNACLGYSQVLLITAGQTRPIVLASVVASSLTLLGLVFVTPLWGPIGAACASAAGVVIYNAIVCVACVRATGIHCHLLAFPVPIPSQKRPNQ